MSEVHGLTADEREAMVEHIMQRAASELGVEEAAAVCVDVFACKALPQWQGSKEWFLALMGQAWEAYHAAEDEEVESFAEVRVRLEGKPS